MKKQTFLTEVTERIKSKEAKKYVAEELSFHIQEAKKAWEKKGLTVTEAEEKAIEQMGSPVQLGIQMNKLHRPKVDWWMVTLLGLALLLGFLPLFSLGYMKDTSYFAVMKAGIVILGVVAAVGLMLIDYRKWQKKGWLFYSLGVMVLLAIRFFPNRTINGVPRIEVGPLTIESLMAVPLFLLAWASFFNNRKFTVWQFFILFLIPLLLFMAIPSLVSVYIYTIMVFVMLWWSQFSRKTIGSIFAVSIGSVLVIGLFSLKYVKMYQLERLLAFLHPEDFPHGAGFLILRLREYLSQAGWFGHSGVKEFIPEAHTNFVFVTMIYHYGWIFATIVAAILSLFAARIIFVSFQIKDTYGKVLLIGAVALYLAQFATNVLMSLGLFPLLGISLPFMSYGLMPTLLNAVLIGIVLSVYRRKSFAV